MKYLSIKLGTSLHPTVESIEITDAPQEGTKFGGLTSWEFETLQALQVSSPEALNKLLQKLVQIGIEIGVPVGVEVGHENTRPLRDEHTDSESLVSLQDSKQIIYIDDRRKIISLLNTQAALGLKQVQIPKQLHKYPLKHIMELLQVGVDSEAGIPKHLTSYPVNDVYGLIQIGMSL